MTGAFGQKRLAASNKARGETKARGDSETSTERTGEKRDPDRMTFFEHMAEIALEN
jgi:hypothetical protein